MSSSCVGDAEVRVDGGVVQLWPSGQETVASCRELACSRARRPWWSARRTGRNVVPEPVVALTGVARLLGPAVRGTTDQPDDRAVGGAKHIGRGRSRAPARPGSGRRQTPRAGREGSRLPRSYPVSPSRSHRSLLKRRRGADRPLGTEAVIRPGRAPPRPMQLGARRQPPARLRSPQVALRSRRAGRAHSSRPPLLADWQPRRLRPCPAPRPP